jgi:ribosomal protein S18 acetylase RimI-like enzyme
LTGPHELTALGAFVDNRLAGFSLGGVFHGSLSGFLAKNRRFLAYRILSHPWLLVNPIVRDRLSVGRKALPNLVKPKRSSMPAEGTRPRSFGVLTIAVEPRLQGSGIGKLLMKRTEEIAHQLSFPEMRLSVHPDNHQAVHFYENLHWERVIRNGVWNGEMKKALSV